MKTSVGFFLAVGVIVSIAARADVDWKWDTSLHVEAAPAVATADISSSLPAVTAADPVERFLNLYGFSFLESNLFRLSGSPAGLIVVVQ